MEQFTFAALPTGFPLSRDSFPFLFCSAFGGGYGGGGGGGNRRPGDWNCPACNAHNFASKTACFRCQAPKPDNLPPDGGYGGFQGGGGYGGDNRRPGDWDCGACGAHNFASRSACYKCQTPKGDVGTGGGGDETLMPSGDDNMGGGGGAFPEEDPSGGMGMDTGAPPMGGMDGGMTAPPLQGGAPGLPGTMGGFGGMDGGFGGY